MKPEKQAELFDHIDHAINDAPPSIEDSINEAIQKGRMTLQEGMECIEAYERSFLKGHELWDE